MQKKLSSSSNSPDDRLEKDSVYDFLYQDARRVGSYLSQLAPAGHVQELKKTTSTQETGEMGAAISAGASVAVAKTGGEFTARTGNINQKLLEQTIDPLWTNAVDLLNLLTERDIIIRGITEARIGQIVLVSGTLAVSDLSILRDLWNTSFIQIIVTKQFEARHAPQGSRTERRADKAASAKATVSGLEQVKAVLEVVKILPHGVFAMLSDNSGASVWGALRAESLIVPPSDLLLAHGTTIAGQWNMIGVLDARPDSPPPANAPPVDEPESSSVGDLLRQFAPVVRSMVGRPESAYGMTPLLIFRQIGA